VDIFIAERYSPQPNDINKICSISTLSTLKCCVQQRLSAYSKHSLVEPAAAACRWLQPSEHWQLAHFLLRHHSHTTRTVPSAAAALSEKYLLTWIRSQPDHPVRSHTWLMGQTNKKTPQLTTPRDLSNSTARATRPSYLPS